MRAGERVLPPRRGKALKQLLRRRGGVLAAAAKARGDVAHSGYARQRRRRHCKPRAASRRHLRVMEKGLGAHMTRG